jgi:hypothetical protein
VACYRENFYVYSIHQNDKENRPISYNSKTQKAIRQRRT